jgi:hypothetical protein
VLSLEDRVSAYHEMSRQNSTLHVLVAEGRNVLGQQTWLWSTEVKVWEIVPKVAWYWGGDSSVANNPYGAPGSTQSYVCFPPAWGFEGGDCLIPRFLWDVCGPQEIYRKKMAKAEAEFKFWSLGKFFMEQSDFEEIPLCKILYFVRGMGLLAE